LTLTTATELEHFVVLVYILHVQNLVVLAVDDESTSCIDPRGTAVKRYFYDGSDLVVGLPGSVNFKATTGLDLTVGLHAIDPVPRLEVAVGVLRGGLDLEGDSFVIFAAAGAFAGRHGCILG
jgi:hypothetical protein